MPRGKVIAPHLLFLALILLAYLALAGAYALNTPPGQAPDEPAHLNYIRYLAQGKGLPVLQPGDYDFEYMERIKAARFPPEMSIDLIRYESHQPPLYYLLLVPGYWAVAGLPLTQQVVLLRLLSLFLGLLLLVIIYRAIGQVFPGDQALALGGTAFAAFIPQHLHIVASVNNDVLGELLLSSVLFLLVGMLRTGGGRNPWPTVPILGLALGLALLAKTSAYVAVALVPLGLVLAETLGGPFQWGRALGRTAAVYGVALALSGWWFARNLLVYGDLDLFGLGRHALVVVGQPRVGVFDWEAAARFVAVSFQSFWAQFGWMGVPSDTRTYAYVGLLSLLAAAGLALFLARQARRPSLSPQQTASLALLAVAFLLILGGTVRYNLEFIQPQGRYLYPAILPLGLFFVLGLGELMGRRRAPPMAVLSLSLLALAAYNLWRVLIPAFG